MNKKIILAVAVLVILAIVGYGLRNSSWEGILKGNKTLSLEEAKTAAQDFIVGNLVSEGTKVEIANISEENGLYKLDLNVGTQNITAYISKDGQKFFPSVLDVAETKKQSAEKKAQADEPSAEIPKAEKPTIDLYVMSFCPFGNKAEDTLKPVYELLKNKADFNFRYIVSSEGDVINSLHGEKEVAQNEREACVMKEYGKDAWMNFVTYINTNCGSDGACWEEGAKKLSFDSAKISACVLADGKTLMLANGKASNEAGANGSPTMIINGVKTEVVYQYGNSESYKQAICGAFSSAPEECSQTLSAETSTAAGGSCE